MPKKVSRSLAHESHRRTGSGPTRRRLFSIGVCGAAVASGLAAPGAQVAAAAQAPQSGDTAQDPPQSGDLLLPPSDPGNSNPATTSTDSSSATRSLVVADAYKQLGKPYRWGAKGPSSFDCSGFAGYVFDQIHLQLPRTSQAQFHTGKPVNRGSIQPGDLVFFNTDGSGGASHVGIAVSPTEAISAGTHEGVRKHSITQGYWGAHFVGARSEL